MQPGHGKAPWEMAGESRARQSVRTASRMLSGILSCRKVRSRGTRAAALVEWSSSRELAFDANGIACRRAICA